MAYELIETVTLTSAASSIEFTSIPQDGVDLLLKVSSRTTYTAGVTGFVLVTINGETTGYNNVFLAGYGDIVTTVAGGTDAWRVIYTASNSATANTFGNGGLHISNYTSSNPKSASMDTVGENNATEARQLIGAHSHTTTSPITSLTIAPLAIAQLSYDFVAGSTASLYKIS